jgi:Ketosteroid isomerase homolog
LRFQTKDRVPCDDAELVLAVLEDRLHTLAHEVVREGRRITLFGLGPSPRAVNPRDKTMIDVSAVDGVTTIDADVTFQASSFLGEVPQDQIVRGKLERVFDEIKAELGLNARRDATNGTSMARKVVPIKSAAAEPVVVITSADGNPGRPEAAKEMIAETEAAAAPPRDVSSAVVEETQIAESASAPVAAIARVDEEPKEITATASLYEEPVEAAAAAPAPIVAQDSIRIVFAEPEPQIESLAVKEAEPFAIIEPEPVPIAKPEPVAVAKPKPKPKPKPVAVAKAKLVAVARPRAKVPVEMRRESERWVADALSGLDEKEPGTWRRVGWTAAAVGLVAIVIFGARDLVNMDKMPDADASPVTVSAMTSTPVSAPLPASTTAAAPTTASAPEPKPSLPSESDDPAEVVKQWEQAMQSRDAAAQAAFYANTVERYFLRNNVGKDAVLADKQAEIDQRKGSWTIKMDRVKVDRQGDAATVSLVKHFTMQGDGDRASEWFVPTQLKLKHEDGQWRIVSERALGWASSLDDLDG